MVHSERNSPKSKNTLWTDPYKKFWKIFCWLINYYRYSWVGNSIRKIYRKIHFFLADAIIPVRWKDTIMVRFLFIFYNKIMLYNFIIQTWPFFFFFFWRHENPSLSLSFFPFILQWYVLILYVLTYMYISLTCSSYIFCPNILKPWLAITPSLSLKFRSTEIKGSEKCAFFSIAVGLVDTVPGWWVVEETRLALPFPIFHIFANA